MPQPSTPSRTPALIASATTLLALMAAAAYAGGVRGVAWTPGELMTYGESRAVRIVAAAIVVAASDHRAFQQTVAASAGSAPMPQDLPDFQRLVCSVREEALFHDNHLSERQLDLPPPRA